MAMATSKPPLKNMKSTSILRRMVCSLLVESGQKPCKFKVFWTSRQNGQLLPSSTSISGQVWATVYICWKLWAIVCNTAEQKRIHCHSDKAIYNYNEVKLIGLEPL